MFCPVKVQRVVPKTSSTFVCFFTLLEGSLRRLHMNHIYTKDIIKDIGIVLQLSSRMACGGSGVNFKPSSLGSRLAPTIKTITGNALHHKVYRPSERR